jgi:hypothetical protein
MGTPYWMAQIGEQSEQIQLQLGDLDEKLDSLADQSKLDCSEDPRGSGQGNAIHDVASIHFDTTRGHQTDQNTYLMSLANNLTIRNLDITGSIDEMQERLKKALVLEYIYTEGD